MFKNAFIAMLLIAINIAPAHARFITGFKSEVYRDDYGKVMFRAIPNAYDMHRPRNTKSWKVWGVLLCYTVDGERKAKRQDMTYDIMTEGVYEIALSYSSKSSVTNIEAEYFEVSRPKESWPSLSSC